MAEKYLNVAWVLAKAVGAYVEECEKANRHLRDMRFSVTGFRIGRSGRRY